MIRRYERATCPDCGRRISTWVPHCGDGTDVRIVKHNVRIGLGKTRVVRSCPSGGEFLHERRKLLASLKLEYFT